MTDDTDTDPDREEEIIQAVADGLSATKAAKRFGLSLKNVRALIKREADALSDGQTLREQWMLEDRRLRAIGLLFYEKAIKEGNPADAMIFIKASERRATMNGANAPTSHQIHLMNDAAPDQRSSTQKLSDVLDHVLGITDRERDLRNRRDAAKWNDGPPLTQEEEAEYRAMQDARETKRREDYDSRRDGGGSGGLH